MDNGWERLAQSQVRQMGDIVHRLSFCKYSRRASDADFSDLFAESRRECLPKPLTLGNNSRLKQPSALDRGEDQEDEPRLDAAIWRDLPENLIESIFPHLPLHSLLRFRAVCKRWNSLLHCRPFLQSWRLGQGVHRENPWLIFRGSARECVAYNPGMDRWSNIPLSFLPSPRVRVVASAGGLLCVRRRDGSLMVCNPFTKSYIQLPPRISRWKYPLIGMVADRKDSYKLIVAGSHGVLSPNLTTEVYDSTTRSWKLVGTPPLRHHLQTNAVYYNGFLYSAGFSVIMVYDVEKEIWSDLKGPPVTQQANLIMPQICECRGRLLMVEVVSECFLMRRVSIWGNDFATTGDDEWVMLDTMPDNILEEVILMSRTRFFSYFGHEDLLCFVIARREILAYSVSTKIWRWLPTCPYIQGFAQRFAAFAFHSTLDACE